MQKVLEDLPMDGEKDFQGTMYFKVCMDGASSQSVYKQVYEDNDVRNVSYEEIQNEQSMFQTDIS